MSPKTAIQNKELRRASIQKIKDAAFLLMAKNGYESTSIAQIANEAGVSKGLLYNYFDSKRALLQSLIEQAFETGDAIVSELVSDEPGKTIEAMFTWFFKDLKMNADTWKLITQLALQVDKYEFVKKIIKDKMNGYVEILKSLLGDLGYKNPELESMIIFAIMDGIGVEYLILKEEYPLDEMEKFLINKYCG